MEINSHDAHAEYRTLCHIANKQPVSQPIQWDQPSAVISPSEQQLAEQFTAALSVFIDCLTQERHEVDRIDRVLLDHYIAKLDNQLSQQLDMILHDKKFQQLESLWRSLYYLVDKTDFDTNVEIQILDVSKAALQQDLQDNLDLQQTELYQHVYTREYDTPGGEPFSAIISDYEFTSSSADIDLLSYLGEIAMLAHSPFIGAVGADFFHKSSMNDLIAVSDLEDHMERAEFLRWTSFRESPVSRYVGLTLPKFLLRLPYGDVNPTRDFYYEESAISHDDKKYLWGNASFAFAANLTQSFIHHGWPVNIRGLDSGGKVENLPLHHYDFGRGLQTKMPMEVLLAESQEMTLSELGFIPLTYYKNSDYACFFSANSTQKAKIYQQDDLTANSRINARLPYVFLVSRIGHYLKVLQRENIGTSKSPQQLETELNQWLQSLVTKMNTPSADIIANYPLREGLVKVTPKPDNPGVYQVELEVMPHFQVEGMDVRLSLNAQYSKKNQ